MDDSRHPPLRVQFLTYLFFAATIMLFNSGRLGSYDAFGQLQAATIWAKNGTLGTDQPVQNTRFAWVKGPSGKFYESHDIGNVILMYLPAKIGLWIMPQGREQQINDPSIAARFAVSVSVALWSALGCLFVVKTFCCFWSFRQAFLLAIAFAATTTFFPYTKSAWDVCGSCIGVAIMLYGAAKMLTSNPIPCGGYVAIAVGFVAAVSFRYSTAPFLAVSLAIVAWCCRARLERRYLALSVLIIAIGVLPSLLYNYVRMGSPLRPATTAEQYASNLGLSGNIPNGLCGLLISPGRGFFAFSPICLALFATPFIWVKIPKAGRQLIFALGVGAGSYIVMIAKLPAWNTFGWGPRYLVPMLPILFLPVAFVIQMFWHRAKATIVSLLLLSGILNGVAVLVNWDLATANYEPLKAHDSSSSHWVPYQQMAVWNGLRLGLHGEPLPGGQLDDDVRKASGRFPDLWIVRLMERSNVGEAVGIAALLALAATSAALLLKLLKVRWAWRVFAN